MDQFHTFYLKAIYFLKFRPRSEQEIRDKLISKKAPEEIIDQVIAKLKEQKFLNDEEFARMWIRQRLETKPRSQWLIKRELKMKGISQEITDRMIQDSSVRQAQDDPEYIEGSEHVIQDLQIASKIVEKKIAKYKHLSRQEVHQKLGGYLARKGFNWDTIKRSIDEGLQKEV